MKKVEITTTQNVTFEYNIATVVERWVAWFIDLLIIGAATGIIATILGSLKVEGEAVYILFLVPTGLFYSLVFEIFNNGQSLGKMAMNIRVMKITGEKPSIFDYFTRWAFRVIEINICLGTIAALTIMSSVYGQRIGDALSDMVVIKLEKASRFSLKKVIQLDKLSNYTPVYPEVTQFNEEEMILIKETMDRYIKYNTKGHKEAMNLLLKKIEDKLQVTVPSDKIAFLKTLVKDYVSLTR